MRVWTKMVVTAALVAPMALTVVGTGSGVAGAAGGTSCGTAKGTATFKPALPVSGDSTTVKPAVIVKNGKVSRCSGSVTSGTFVSKSKFHDATNCDKLLSGAPSAHPPTGTITTTWNTGKTSTASITLNPVSGQPTETHITGTVTSGLFSGKSISATLSFTPKTGDCITTPLSKVTFKLVSGTKLTIK